VIKTVETWSPSRDWGVVDFEVVLITPDTATLMLERNTRNRPFRVARAMEFMDLLNTPGAFYHTQEGIAFYADGTLADGQHRLAAIRRSGKSVYMDVRYGVPVEASHSINIGIRRRPGDVLSLLGYNDTNVLAAALKIVWQYLNDDRRLVVRFSDHEHLVSMVEMYGQGEAGLLEYLKLGRMIYTELKIPPSSAAAAAYLIGIPPDENEEYFAGLLGNGERYANDPRTALERQVNNARMQNKRLNGLWLTAIQISAFRAYDRERSTPVAERKGARHLAWRVTEPLPVAGRIAHLRKVEQARQARLAKFLAEAAELTKELEQTNS
jgi:hypothetical protein